MDYKETSEKLGAILFANGDPLRHSFIVNILEINKNELKEVVEILKTSLKETGLILIETEETLVLGTAPSASALIEKMRKDELEKPLGRAGLETLTIILYRGPVTKSEIDYVRGVDSGSIVRNLTVRGLVERKEQEGTRGFIYSHTIDTLRFLGISSTKDLPEYEENNLAIDASPAVEA